jgi:circadian clock protein KaiC
VHAILEAIRKTGARRLVIDSLPGFEIALAPGFREDFRESFYRMIVALTGRGITTVSTLEVEDSFTEFPFSSHSLAFLFDDLIRLRYVEVDGQIRKILMVLKMRSGAHSRDIREYEITPSGVVIGQRLTGYDRLLTGVPTRAESPMRKE